MATYHSTVYLSFHLGWWTLAIMNKATMNIFVQIFFVHIYAFISLKYICRDGIAESERRVQLFATLRTVAHQAPLSVGTLQARILEWVAMFSSRASSQPRYQTQVSCIASGFFTIWATREAHCKNTGVSSLSLLQGISLTQESNWGLLHCRQILYQLSYDWAMMEAPSSS